MNQLPFQSRIDPVEFYVVCRSKYNLQNQTDSNATLLPYLTHQLGLAHGWSGVWKRPNMPETRTHFHQSLPHYQENNLFSPHSITLPCELTDCQETSPSVSVMTCRLDPSRSGRSADISTSLHNTAMNMSLSRTDRLSRNASIRHGCDGSRDPSRSGRSADIFTPLHNTTMTIF